MPTAHVDRDEYPEPPIEPMESKDTVYCLHKTTVTFSQLNSLMIGRYVFDLAALEMYRMRKKIVAAGGRLLAEQTDMLVWEGPDIGGYSTEIGGYKRVEVAKAMQFLNECRRCSHRTYCRKLNDTASR